MTRLEKYRKTNREFMLIVKTALIFYLLLFSVSYLTSHTVAYFSGEKQVTKMTISSGVWDEEDESAFGFIDGDAFLLGTCPATIEVELVNHGTGPMLADGSYEIYYIEEGDPTKDGERLELLDDEGIIEILEVGGTKKITHITDVPGYYAVVAYHPTDEEKEAGIWSAVIHIECEEEDITEEPEEKEEEKEIESKEPITEEGHNENKKVDEETAIEGETEETDQVEEPIEGDAARQEDSGTIDEETTEPETEPVEDRPTTSAEDEEDVKPNEEEAATKVD